MGDEYITVNYVYKLNSSRILQNHKVKDIQSHTDQLLRIKKINIYLFISTSWIEKLLQSTTKYNNESYYKIYN